MRKRWHVPKKKNNLFSNRRWTNQTSWRRSRPENIHFDTTSTKSRRKSRWFSWRIRRVSSTTSRFVSGCRWSDKWLLVHVRKLHIPPSRWTQSQILLAESLIHTNLDVNQERRIDDYWNIDGSRDLSDSWIGFTQFTLLEEKLPNKKMCSGGRLSRKQLTSRPYHMWPELWEKMRKNAKLKEKQKWPHEKPQLDNARKLRGIYFIDPEDKEFKETFKNACKKLETPIAPAMPCKIMKNNCGSGVSNKIKTRLACILEASESTRLRMGESLPNHLEDHVAGQGDNSLQHYNLVHKFIPMPLKPYKFLQQRQQWTRNGNSGENFGVESDESQK